ncbi:putative metallophosphoesterase YkoQ [Alicyclobacillus cellulosilyticus]|uniref:Metallophosphoesterase YkoQ n=1 Tax=Alicyclobacillus cellulosilyticus TaxID=1003997 RepID=A0A917NKM7_9BACL|nr:metallophosphoesterase [Alicyclobacillus cellulosilyticus]GGJ04994.1 putative metallophosphoesterase YkoQ [Alicyclobacillus cellulosilyticus]
MAWEWSAAGSVVAAVIASYVLFILPTQWLKVERVKLPLGWGIKVLHVSDLHVEKNRIPPQRLARLVDAERPDFICLTGDFLDSMRAIRRLDRYLSALCRGEARVYAVLGNHDDKAGQRRALAAHLARRGIRVLLNEAEDAGVCWVIGIDDFRTRRADPARAFARVPPGVRRLLLTHDPNVLALVREPYDLALAGHLHGKQFNLPGLFWLRPMGPLPRRGIYQGLHRLPEGWLYISKGVGQVGLNARLFVRSEVSVVEL